MRRRRPSQNEFYCLLDRTMRDPDGLQWQLGLNSNALSWPPLSVDDTTAGLRVFANGSVFSQPFSSDLTSLSLGVCTGAGSDFYEARDGMSWRFREVMLLRLLAFDELFGDLYVHFVACAVAHNPHVLAKLPPERVTRQLVDEAIRRGAHIVPLLPRRFMTRSVLLEACLGNLHNLEDVPRELQQDRDFLWDVCRLDWRAMRFMSEAMRTRELCQAVCPLFPESLPLVPQCWLTREMCEGAVFKSGMLLEFVPDDMVDECLWLLAVQSHGDALQFVPLASRSRKLCMEACCRTTSALRWTPPQLQKERGFMRKVLLSPNFALRLVPPELMTDALLLEAVSRSGDELEFVPQGRRTKKLCERAVKQNAFALKFVPQELQTVKLVTRAVKREFRAIACVSDPELVKSVLKKLKKA